MIHNFVETAGNSPNRNLVDGPRWNAVHQIGVTQLSANTTLDNTYDFIEATGGLGGGISITLPSPSGIAGRIYKIMKVDAAVGVVTVVGTINGDTNYILSNQFQYVEVQASFDGTRWLVTDAN